MQIPIYIPHLFLTTTPMTLIIGRQKYDTLFFHLIYLSFRFPNNSDAKMKLY